MSVITYKESGVDIDAGDELVDRIGPSVKRTMRPEVLAGVGGFASLVALPKGYKEPLLVAGTDGVGTKLKIAFAMDEHRTIGIDLVAMCANDVLAVGGEPLFFLDYYGCGKLDPKAAAEAVAGIADGCLLAGAALVGGETAELPGFYHPGEYDLAGFLVGVVERDEILTGADVQPGDAVLGLSSSGLHSNGYSLARAIVEKSGVPLSETPAGFSQTLGRTLLEPTIIYVKPVLALRSEVRVKALAHITGGGIVENVPRTLPDGLGARLRAGWPVPPVFRWLAERGPVAPPEMLRTFNMGIGMTAVVAPDDAPRAIGALGRSGVAARVIGEIVEAKGDGPRVFVEGAIL
jgi:phosphoribosylformylglycinamidine cyclo-ligase